VINVVVEPKSAPSTVTYEKSFPTQDNPYDWAVDWSDATTSLYLGALPSGFEQAIDYFEANRNEIEKAFRGKFVAIWENTIIDSDADFSELAGRIYGQYGYIPIYMPFAGRRLKLQFPSPRVRQPKKNAT